MRDARNELKPGQSVRDGLNAYLRTDYRNRICLPPFGVIF